MTTPAWRVVRAGAAAAAALGIAAGCAERPAPSPPAATGAPGAPGAEWVVVGHRIPGVAAMTDAEAAAWHGRVLGLGPGEAASGADTCAVPAYKEREAPADSLLGAGYRIRAADLGMPAAGARLRVLRVSCAGSPWAAFGGVLLRTGEDRAFAPWDGVFFELSRLPPP